MGIDTFTSQRKQKTLEKTARTSTHKPRLSASYL